MTCLSTHVFGWLVGCPSSNKGNKHKEIKSKWSKALSTQRQLDQPPAISGKCKHLYVGSANDRSLRWPTKDPRRDDRDRFISSLSQQYILCPHTSFIYNNSINMSSTSAHSGSGALLRTRTCRTYPPRPQRPFRLDLIWKLSTSPTRRTLAPTTSAPLAA